MNKFLQKLTIRQKIRFGFGAIWVVLAIITIQAAVNLYMVRVNIKDVVKEKQPITLVSNQLIHSLDNTITSLSSYILTGNQAELDSYEQSFALSKRINLDLENLISKQSADKKKISSAHLAEVEQELAKLPLVVEQIKAMQADTDIKYPAFRFVDRNMSGPAAKVQQHISSMIASEMTTLSPLRAEIIRDLLALQSSWLNVLSSVRGYVAFRSEDMSNNTAMYLDVVGDLLDKITTQRRVELTFEEEEALPEIIEEFTTYRNYFQELRIIHSGEKWRMDIWVMDNELKPIFTKLAEELNALADFATQDMLKVSESVVSSSLRNIFLLLLFSVAGQLVGMFISRRVTEAVVEPVSNVVVAMQDMAQGDGDLTRRLPVKGQDELAQVAEYFNEFVARIQQMLLQIRGTIKELEGSSQSLLGVTASTRQGAGKQLQAAANLNMSIQKVLERSHSVEAHSNNTSTATEEAATRVREGRQVVSNANKQIQSLSNAMSEISDATNQLNMDSASIGQVASVIRDIAEQTNLLALNAAIEAARAGEHGRGFAVVADEVRGLAQRTQESTLEIERIIAKIREATEKTVSVVSEGHKSSESSREAIQKAHDEISPVVSLMDDISVMSDEVLNEAREQANLAGMVNNHIIEIHQVSEQTAQDAINTENSGNQMQELADRLENLVKQFKV